MDHCTFDKNDILNDDSIDLIVEAIDDADAAFEILKIAFKNGKDVVTANKKMLANHLEEIIALQEEFGRSVLYEGSSCGSIPIIRNLEEYYDNEPPVASFALSELGRFINHVHTRTFTTNR